jgi:hypothetical protein
MMRELDKKRKEDYLINTAETHAVTDRSNTAHEKNAKRVCDSQAAADIAEAMAESGGDDDEEGESEAEDDNEDGDGTHDSS